MMSYEQWLSCILGRARAIASRAHQEETWKAGGDLVSSPDEVYQALMEDCTADLFFETYGTTLTEEEMRCWRDLRTLLTSYYDKMSLYADPAQVLTDPEWELVRQAAGKFIQAFNGHSSERSE
jgi:hypothetical protein